MTQHSWALRVYTHQYCNKGWAIFHSRTSSLFWTQKERCWKTAIRKR